MPVCQGLCPLLHLLDDSYFVRSQLSFKIKNTRFGRQAHHGPKVSEPHARWLETSLWWEMSCSIQDCGLGRVPAMGNCCPSPYGGKPGSSPGWVHTAPRPDNWYRPHCIPEQLQNGADACMGACLQLLPNLITFLGMKLPITN